MARKTKKTTPDGITQETLKRAYNLRESRLSLERDARQIKKQEDDIMEMVLRDVDNGKPIEYGMLSVEISSRKYPSWENAFRDLCSRMGLDPDAEKRNVILTTPETRKVSIVVKVK